MNYFDFVKILSPEIVLLLVAMGIIGMGCRGGKFAEAGACAFLSFVGVLLAVGALIFCAPDGQMAGGMIVLDPLVRLVKFAILAMVAVAVVLLQADRPSYHVAENFAMLLFAAIGLLLIVGTEEMLVIFVGLELAGLALYALAGFARSDLGAAEAALKYFLFGSVAAAFLLYGMSLIFGVCGTTELQAMSAALRKNAQEPILTAGLAMALVGFGFKVAAVPFHLWAPDVYQGAPTPAAAFVASGSKVAGFFILAKFLFIGFGGLEGSAGWGSFAPGWVPMLGVMAALSMVVGNLMALVQKSVRRMLAYSGIGHAGFLLLALMAASAESLEAVVFYTVIYGVATLGAFGVVGVVVRERGGDSFSRFAGLVKREPVLSFSMLVFLCSLAGLPPLAGFFGKFFLFTAAMGAGGILGAAPGLLWLVALALFFSAVSLYYYLLVLKQIFFVSEDGVAGCRGEGLGVVPRAVIFLLAVVTVGLGCFPDLLLGPIHRAVEVLLGN